MFLKFSNESEAIEAADEFFSRIFWRRINLGYQPDDTYQSIIGKNKKGTNILNACKTVKQPPNNFENFWYVSVSNEVDYSDLGGEMVETPPFEQLSQIE